ncbi:MAG: acyltransferase [Methylococcaceae bacterium]|jgi:peptidoglycan/LPS O-acetylase OafA/YrhL
MRLKTFDYFRGLAILLIVAGHSYGPWVAESFQEKVLASLITGATSYFVFMSGFFFHYIFYPQFQYQRFMLKKIKNVLLPYTLLSLLAVLWFVFYLQTPPYADIFVNADTTGSWLQQLGIFLRYWWTGAILTAYWYVPFIMIIFTLSPIFIKQIALPLKVQIILISALLAFSSLVHRPLDNLSPLHSVIYFLPIYALGIICSINKTKVFDYLKGKSLQFGVLVLVLAVLQIVIYDNYGNFHKASIWAYRGVDTMIFQKIAMCFFFLSILQGLEDKNIPFLKLLGSASFAIYFLHPWVMYGMESLAFLEHIRFLPSFAGFITGWLIVVAVSLALAFVLKLIFHEKSRYLIGW